MTGAGQFCLLLAMICSGYSAVAASLAAMSGEHRGLSRGAAAAAFAAFASITSIVIVLVCALVLKDFRFEYVTEYSDPLLPWHYSLSALWVGQAGSLLVWGWFVAALAIVRLRVSQRARPRLWHDR